MILQSPFSKLICNLCDKIIPNDPEHTFTVMDIGCGYHSYILDIRKQRNRKVCMYIVNLACILCICYIM